MRLARSTLGLRDGYGDREGIKHRPILPRLETEEIEVREDGAGYKMADSPRMMDDEGRGAEVGMMGGGRVSVSVVGGPGRRRKLSHKLSIKSFRQWIQNYNQQRRPVEPLPPLPPPPIAGPPLVLQPSSLRPLRSKVLPPRSSDEDSLSASNSSHRSAELLRPVCSLANLSASAYPPPSQLTPTSPSHGEALVWFSPHPPKSRLVFFLFFFS